MYIYMYIYILSRYCIYSVLQVPRGTGWGHRRGHRLCLEGWGTRSCYPGSSQVPQGLGRFWCGENRCLWANWYPSSWRNMFYFVFFCWSAKVKHDLYLELDQVSRCWYQSDIGGNHWQWFLGLPCEIEDGTPLFLNWCSQHRTYGPLPWSLWCISSTYLLIPSLSKQEAHDPELGARPLKRYLERHLVSRCSNCQLGLCCVLHGVFLGCFFKHFKVYHIWRVHHMWKPTWKIQNISELFKACWTAEVDKSAIFIYKIWRFLARGYPISGWFSGGEGLASHAVFERWTSHLATYPPEIKHSNGKETHPPFIDDIPSYKPPFISFFLKPFLRTRLQVVPQRLHHQPPSSCGYGRLSTMILDDTLTPGSVVNVDRQMRNGKVHSPCRNAERAGPVYIYNIYIYKYTCIHAYVYV